MIRCVTCRVNVADDKTYNSTPYWPSFTSYPAFTCSMLINKDTRTGGDLYSRLTMLTYFTPCSSVSIVNFEHAIAG